MNATETPSLETFRAELGRLVEQFGRNLSQYKSNAYDEASLRQEFLNPFFRALGWDVENKAGFIPQHREVEIESRTEIAGRQKRADYLFRTDRQDRFVCEAKKPAEVLHARYAFQAKRYAWNKGLVLAVLTDFEEMLVYVVGSKPHPDEGGVGLWKTWRFQQYPLVIQEIWELLSRQAVGGGSIEKLVEGLPHKPTAKGKARQQWLIKPDRSKALDADFLNFLDDARRDLASDLIRHNDREDLLEGVRLNEAVQHILDRLLFLRICEDRDIDTGRPLARILESWRKNAEDPVPRRVRQSEFLGREDEPTFGAAAKPAPQRPLWSDVVAHFRALDRRPPSHIPFFNGNLFKPHFSEDLEVSDEWIAGFLDDVSDEESPYLFNVIPVEILGIIYERFLGKVVRPKGRGVLIEEKPEVRKAGGVYYTPRYIVDYIVEQTVGKLLTDMAPQASLKLRVLDPACGSGSFLICAFERLCEHWQTAMMKDEKVRRKRDCWTDPSTGDLHLTTDLKRRILTANIYGVDIDAGAVEVTQLSLYLKMLEGENRTTLARERDLFGSDIALLPPLQDNIKCGNSLIASDFSIIPEDLVRVHAFDWQVQFAEIMKSGGFDVVIGNPPWGSLFSDTEKNYLGETYVNRRGEAESHLFFTERAFRLINESGIVGYITPNTWLSVLNARELRSYLLQKTSILELYELSKYIFADAPDIVPLLIFLGRQSPKHPVCVVKRSAVVKINSDNFSQAFHMDRISQNIWSTSPTATINLRASSGVLQVCDKCKKAGIPLDSICGVLYGIKTGNNTKYVQSQQTEKHKVKALKTGELVRYGIQWKGFWLWWCKQLAGYRNSAVEVPKIIVQYIRKISMPRRIIAAFDERGKYYPLNNYSYIEAKDRAYSLSYVLGVLNSALLNFYFANTFIDYNMVLQT